MADYLPNFADATTLTAVASGNVTGGRLVAVTGATATGAECVLGVAGADTLSGQPFTVWCDGVHRLPASAAIALGDPVKAAPGGAVAKWVSGTDAVNLYIGDALSAGGAGALVDVRFRF